MNLNSINFLRKPEYFFGPRQIIKRLINAQQTERSKFTETVLPWGLKIRIRPNENIGAAIWRTGVFELSVSEAIWRLLDVGEKAIDVGANIGYMSSIMAVRVGKFGLINSFEPHPEIFEELITNTTHWKSCPNLGEILTHKIALSDKIGIDNLLIDKMFESNRGTASLPRESIDSISKIPVETNKLNVLFNQNEFIGLMKIDVEGHELSVLKGGDRLIKNHQIRDILFEEHATPPTPVTEFLRECGYTIFYISKGFLSVKTHNVESSFKRESYESPNYIATINPSRALEKLRKLGWSVLK